MCLSVCPPACVVDVDIYTIQQYLLLSGVGVVCVCVWGGGGGILSIIGVLLVRKGCSMVTTAVPPLSLSFSLPLPLSLSQVEVRPMMYVALTYDHRLIDGREAVLFLKKIKQSVEDPRTLLLDL